MNHCSSCSLQGVSGVTSRFVEDFVQTGGCLYFPQFLWFLCLYNQQQQKSVIECIRASGQQLHHYYTVSVCVCAGGLTYYNLHTTVSVCWKGVGGSSSEPVYTHPHTHTPSAGKPPTASSSLHKTWHQLSCLLSEFVILCWSEWSREQECVLFNWSRLVGSPVI